MTARTKSKVTPKYKTKYKVKNWPAYEAALKKSGDITVWFDEGAIRAWDAPPSGRPGGQLRYSNVAIVTSLTLRLVFHLALRQTEGFVASELTESPVDDASVGVTMIEEIVAVIESFTADGAYDRRAIYEALTASGAADIKVVIPPKKTAAVDPRAAGPWRQRNEAIERIAKVGRRQWRKESGAHQQAQAENGMYRYKRIIGDSLRAKQREAQRREAMIAVNVINQVTALRMPESVKVTA